ncbi:MAG TPA: beta-ketoacyl-ACP synthase III [Burkholderiales bacterium]|nr:beta-ketoacyl-ACP synthase III [Burkholderiales bacterium]
MTYSRIIGTGSYLPARLVTNHDLAQTVDTSDEWITTRTGIRQRHLAEEGQNTSDLALEASKQALETAGVRAEDLDLIIIATTTPDQVFPSTACLLQQRLGNKGAMAFDMQAVCSGFVYALAVADSLIRAGQARTALVVGAETLSRILDWQDRTTCVLFGDGAGAVVLRADDKPGILASAMHADGSYSGILAAPGKLCGGRIVGNPFVEMDGQAVFKFAVKVLDEVAREAVDRANLRLDDVDWLIPHQANLRILDSTARRLGFAAERVVVTVDRHANTSAASIPLALDVAVRDGRIKAGHKVLLEGVGGGFTWGAVLVQM